MKANELTNGFHVFICHTVKLAKPVLSNVVDPCLKISIIKQCHYSYGLLIKYMKYEI